MTSRTLKVEIAGDFFRRKTHPKIRLQGQWLAKLGFAPGSRVAVIPMMEGEITLKIERPSP
ncbi:MAG: SymE family type I addiction module toxin [Limisphaerales bacterium]